MGVAYYEYTEIIKNNQMRRKFAVGWELLIVFVLETGCTRYSQYGRERPSLPRPNSCPLSD